MNEQKIHFYVPYDEREDAKRLGAKWNKELRRWWVVEGTDMRPFSRWIDPPADYLPEVPFGEPRIEPDVNPHGSLRAIRSRLTNDEWTDLRRKVAKAAKQRCEACGRRGKEHPVECHDVWTFDAETAVQRLLGIHAYCPDCHRVRHAPEELAEESTREAKSRDLTVQMAMVNGWNRRDSERKLKERDDLRASLAGRKWTLDASVLLSYGISLSPETLAKLGLDESDAA